MPPRSHHSKAHFISRKGTGGVDVPLTVPGQTGPSSPPLTRKGLTGGWCPTLPRALLGMSQTLTCAPEAPAPWGACPRGAPSAWCLGAGGPPLGVLPPFCPLSLCSPPSPWASPHARLAPQAPSQLGARGAAPRVWIPGAHCRTASGRNCSPRVTSEGLTPLFRRCGSLGIWQLRVYVSVDGRS